MPSNRKKISTRKKILLSLLVFILLLVTAYHIFITRYVPGIVRQRLNNVITTGSDGLYKFEVGKINTGFWGNSIEFTDLYIYVDSVRYKELKEKKRLPGLIIDLHLPKSGIKGIGLWSMIVRKKLSIDRIDLTGAAIKLSRNFRTAQETSESDVPLWKSIQPTMRSISVNEVVLHNLQINYNNADSATAFKWQFDQCDAVFSGINIDSVSAKDSNRLLFARNVTLLAKDVSLKTPDNLYSINASDIFYTHSTKVLDIKKFGFTPAVSRSEFSQHFGYQHEIYTLAIPAIQLKNFSLPQLISSNELNIDTIDLRSPDIQVYLDRNARPNPYSKLGKYPQQLVQRAPFLINIKRVTTSGATVTYQEKNDKNQLTGKLVFPSLHGFIDHITNDSLEIARSKECIADVTSGVLQTGALHAIFRFDLTDRSGGFSVASTITNLNADQLRPLIKAMTSVEMQSFNMQRLDYVITGNETAATGQLRMKYTDMDVLLNKVDDDGSLNKKGLLSFFVNHLVIYKENPSGNEDERTASNVRLQRDVTRSFFNLIWKTLYSSAGQIVLRPRALKKIEKKKARANP